MITLPIVQTLKETDQVIGYLQITEDLNSRLITMLENSLPVGLDFQIEKKDGKITLQRVAVEATNVFSQIKESDV